VFGLPLPRDIQRLSPWPRQDVPNGISPVLVFLGHSNWRGKKTGFGPDSPGLYPSLCGLWIVLLPRFSFSVFFSLFRGMDSAMPHIGIWFWGFRQARFLAWIFFLIPFTFHTSYPPRPGFILFTQKNSTSLFFRFSFFSSRCAFVKATEGITALRYFCFKHTPTFSF